MTDNPVRWAVLGTANIAAKAFLPAMRAAGGVAVVVGSRDPERAKQWAQANQVARTAAYADALTDPDVDAIYIALPNHEHLQWAKAAVATGKAVLCEKPLGLDTAEVEELLSFAGADAPLWESFAFPFHPQTALIREQLDQLGDLREIITEFHFNVTNPGNIRMQADIGGGAMYDVGCYAVRLARLLFDAEPTKSVAFTFASESGVDVDSAGICDFPSDRRLIFSVGMRRPYSTYTRIIGSTGELRAGNPYHPKPTDTVELWRNEQFVQRWELPPATAFQYEVEHIQDVVRGLVTAQYRAIDNALGNAQALDQLRASYL